MRRTPPQQKPTRSRRSPAAAPDSGGGFLPEAAESAPPRAADAPPAPLPHASLQPQCLDCGTRFPHSYLLDTFDYSVCDACRRPDDAHALLTRTEAKGEFLLKDCDLDARPPPLRALVRRNPHAGGGADMRLYVRAQVEARARQVWGGDEQLRLERERRDERRGRAALKAQQRRLRALRMDVRSSLFRRGVDAHRHRWGPERHDARADEYSRECLDCGHAETYEKM